jgi:hypothetical protein
MNHVEVQWTATSAIGFIAELSALLDNVCVGLSTSLSAMSAEVLSRSPLEINKEFMRVLGASGQVGDVESIATLTQVWFGQIMRSGDKKQPLFPLMPLDTSDSGAPLRAQLPPVAANEGDRLIIVLSLSRPEMPSHVPGGGSQLRIKSLLSDWTIVGYSSTDTFTTLRDELMIKRSPDAVKMHVAFLLADGSEVGGSTMGQFCCFCSVTFLCVPLFQWCNERFDVLSSELSIGLHTETSQRTVR